MKRSAEWLEEQLLGGQVWRANMIALVGAATGIYPPLMIANPEATMKLRAALYFFRPEEDEEFSPFNTVNS